MTSGFEVDWSTLRATAETIERIGEEARFTSVAPGFGRSIEEALPHTTSADAAHALGQSWEQQVRRWSTKVERFGETLAQISRTYERVDEDTQDLMRALTDRFHSQRPGR